MKLKQVSELPTELALGPALEKIFVCFFVDLDPSDQEDLVRNHGLHSPT